VAVSQASERDGEGLQRLLPVDIVRGHLDLIPQRLGDAVEEGVLAVDMVVERHRIHVQLLGQPAHGQGLEPV